MAPYVRGVSSGRVEVCSLECLEVVPLPTGGIEVRKHGASALPTYSDLLAIVEAQARHILEALHPEGE